jgi:hypothetical protein
MVAFDIQLANICSRSGLDWQADRHPISRPHANADAVASVSITTTVPKKLADLFDPIIGPEKRHPLFEGIRSLANGEPARMMANEVFGTFDDPDGNFVEQFQSSGLDARLFELYMYAYLSRSGFEVDRTHQRPDFMVESNGIRAAIEVTTSNRERSFEFNQIRKDVEALTPEARREIVENELPIRLGGPLFDKLKKRYWELPHCSGLPLVIAIEPFHSTTSLLFTSSALANYLYGMRQHSHHDEEGNLVIGSTPVEKHVLDVKSIPSGFFDLKDTENISAVVFTNSGTWGKFTRMGYQAGHHRGNLLICRKGLCNDPDPKANVPAEFFYWLHDPFHEETWGEGLEVFHNPKALVPLPRGYFPSAADTVLDGVHLHSLVPSFHPFVSQLQNFAIDGFELSHEHHGVVVDSITRHEFDALVTREEPWSEPFREREWLSDRYRRIAAVVIEETTNEFWSYAMIYPGAPTEVSQPAFRSCDMARSAAIAELVETLELKRRA